MLKKSEVEAIYKDYKKKWKDTNTEEDNYALEVCVTAHNVLRYLDMVDTEADKLTWGEFTRRYEREMKELETLLKRD